MGQFFLFAFAGGIATALHYTLLVTLVHAGHAPLAASSCGAVCGALVNYGFNRRFTFRSRRAHVEALPRYLLTASAGFLINGAVLGAVLAAHAHYLVAQVAATAVVLLWNFFVNRRWTFRGEGYAQ